MHGVEGCSLPKKGVSNLASQYFDFLYKSKLILPQFINNNKNDKFNSSLLNWNQSQLRQKALYEDPQPVSGVTIDFINQEVKTFFVRVSRAYRQ